MHKSFHRMRVPIQSDQYLVAPNIPCNICHNKEEDLQDSLKSPSCWVWPHNGCSSKICACVMSLWSSFQITCVIIPLTAGFQRYIQNVVCNDIFDKRKRWNFLTKIGWALSSVISLHGAMAVLVQKLGKCVGQGLVGEIWWICFNVIDDTKKKEGSHQFWKSVKHHHFKYWWWCRISWPGPPHITISLFTHRGCKKRCYVSI